MISRISPAQSWQAWQFYTCKYGQQCIFRVSFQRWINIAISPFYYDVFSCMVEQKWNSGVAFDSCIFNLQVWHQKAAEYLFGTGTGCTEVFNYVQTLIIFFCDTQKLFICESAKTIIWSSTWKWKELDFCLYSLHLMFLMFL